MKIFVVGMGVLSPASFGINEFSRSILSGISQISKLENDDYSNIPVKIGGEVKNKDLKKIGIEKMREDRAFYFLDYSVNEAIKAYNLNPIFERIELKKGIFIGTCYNGNETLDKTYGYYNKGQENFINPLFLVRSMRCSSTALVSEKWKLSDFSITVDTACSSSLHAIGLGYLFIKWGVLDLVVAGGTDTPLFPVSIIGWNKLNVLEKDNENPTKVPSPFSKRRKGTVLGEGAGAVITKKRFVKNLV